MSIDVAQSGAELAPAKINLFLHVTGRRADGYHLLDSLVVFAGIADRVAYAPAPALSLELTGPFAVPLQTEADNLVLRAARMLAAEAGVSPSGAMCLEKNIPVASGIGGGSADAAAALRLLRRVWRLELDDAVMQRVAVALGADVPVCLGRRPMAMRGIGERLMPAPELPKCGLLLVNPGVPLATAAVFRARCGGFAPETVLPDRWGTVTEMAGWLSEVGNDLETPAVALVPVIKDVLNAITGTRGCLLARMSGSGATCFGLFADAAAAKAAAADLVRTGWWCWSGALAE